MRLLIKILAVIVGLFGATTALGSLLFLAYFAFGTPFGEVSSAARNLLIGYFAMIALFGGLGYYFLRSAWKHLRKPNLESATNVAGTFSFIMGFWLFVLVSRNLGRPESPDRQASTTVLALELVVIVACYALYRFGLKPLAARAFPANEPPAAPLTSGS